ncbi:MAG: TonB-dependent receptor, partial [Bacteroidia bacterium]|nr:TonB-dependent receptor [Bacteroidia bacterium]
MKKLLAITLCALSLHANAQNNLNGTVNGDYTALPGATIQIEDTYRTTITDANGDFSFSDLEAGRYTLIISYIGYETLKKPVTIPSNKALILNIRSKNFIANEVIIIGTRASKKSAMTYTELNKEEIEENNFGQDFPILLKNTPSVVTTSDAGAGVGYTGIRIRGSDATRINVTINGIPLNDSESGGVFWVNLPDFSSSMESVQIQRGVGTSTNGAGAFGGSVNILTGAPSTDAYANTSMSVGSFNTIKNNVSFGSGIINKHWNIDGRLSKITSDGYVDRATSDLKSFFVSGTYRNKNTLLKLNVFSGKEITYQSWFGVPESILDTNRTYNYYTYDNQVDNYQQDHYQFHVAQKINDKLTLNGALHFTHGEGYFEEYQDVNDFFAVTSLSAYGLDNVV